MALCLKSLTPTFSVTNLLLKSAQRNVAKTRASKVLSIKSYTFAACKHSVSSINKYSLARPTTSLDLKKYFSTKNENTEKEKESTKLTIMQRFKQMYRDYVYVLVPVHLVTSAVWAGGFYYLVKSGVDVIHFMEVIGIPERVIKPMRDSTAGYIALTYALYKIASPVRYTVTLGGTTVLINKLIAMGLIKPARSKENITQMMKEKREDMQNVYQETKQEFISRKADIKERKAKVIEDFRRYKQEIEDIKNQKK